MEKEAAKGRTIVFIITGTIVVIELVLAITELMLGESITLNKIVRWVLTLLLFFLIYKGFRWSRILMVVLSSFAFLSMGVLSFVAIPIWSFQSLSLNLILFWIFSVFVTIAMGASALILAFSKKIKIFQEYQRNNVHPKLND